VKLGVSGQVVIPKKIHDRLGSSAGDFLDVRLDGNRIIFTPKALIDKSTASSGGSSPASVGDRTAVTDDARPRQFRQKRSRIDRDQRASSRHSRRTAGAANAPMATRST
jgi:AbrB family looped-hinge helix DNA binding protein